jgi:NAD(P)-dependent dehydrogenase (short-subunit alcohol dehydrogenase family)
MAVIGLMKTLLIEGEKSNIRINALSPGAATRMTEDLLQEEVKRLMTVDPVSQGMVVLCHAESPNGVILNAQAGSYSITELAETQGLWLSPENQTAEAIAEGWDRISDRSSSRVMKNGTEHVIKMVTMAAQGLGHDI